MSVAFGREDGERSGIGRDIEAIFRVVHGDRINDAPGSLGLRRQDCANPGRPEALPEAVQLALC